MPPAAPPTKVRLGTFSGVFVPSILTILGVILFLRMGFVMGNAGLLQGLLIVLLANGVSVLTSLSVSAIATNVKVEGGGDYYLISRSLGLEYGGPIGLVLFLAQAASVAFYVIGFSEVLTSLFPLLAPYTMLISLIVCAGVFACAYAELDWAAKVQLWILGALCLGLLSFVIGAIPHFDRALLRANTAPGFAQGLSFWAAFAIFFPAITGFTQGISLSGDLEDPERSIPIGTLAAVGAGLTVYVVFAVLLAGSSTRQALLGNYMVMKETSLVPFLIDVGIVAATLSSALTSHLGAPRIFQALARDHVFPFIGWFAAGHGPSGTPRRATVLTFAIAAYCILQGDLNTIAPVVTMFFLISYGLMNYATFVEDFGNNPSFRPRFGFFHWRLSLVGALGCLLAMLFIHTLAAVVAVAGVYAVYWVVDKTVKETSWGDSKRGFYFSKIKEYLLRLRAEPPHVKNWRPKMLVLCGRPKGRLALVKVGLWLEAGRGLLTLANIIPGEVEERLSIRANEMESADAFVKENRLPVFWEVLVARDYIEGVRSLIQAHGIGNVKVNTVVLGWSEQREKQKDFVDTVQAIDRLGRNVVVVEEAEGLLAKYRAGEKALQDLTIDVWWRGEKNGALMLLLAYLWTESPECRKGSIRLLRLVDSEESVEPTRKHLLELSETSRIPAEVKVVSSQLPWTQIIPLESRETDVVFLGLAMPEEGGEQEFIDLYAPLVERLKTTILVHSAEKLDIRL